MFQKCFPTHRLHFLVRFSDPRISKPTVHRPDWTYSYGHVCCEQTRDSYRKYLYYLAIRWPRMDTSYHDDAINWKKCPRYCSFVRWIHRLPVDSPHKGQWRGALMFCLICAWTNGWANNRDADIWYVITLIMTSWYLWKLGCHCCCVYPSTS